MKLPLAIALRFLFRSTRSRPITLFTLVSLLGIFFSVLLFLMIDSLVTGLSTHLRATLLGFEAPLFLEVDADAVPEIQWELEKFKIEHKEFELASVYTRGFDGLISLDDRSPTGIRVRSVNEDFFKIKEDAIDIFWFDGYDADNFSGADDVILIGETLYERLVVFPREEQTVTLTHPFADLGPSGELEPEAKTFAVAGLFVTGRVDFDDVYVLIPDAAMTALANDRLLKNAFFLFPADAGRAPAVQAAWNRTHAKAPMTTWLDKNKGLFRAMRLEKLMYFFVFAFVLVISCFNLMGVIAIFGLSKARAAAVLSALGLTRTQIRRIFTGIGFVLGLTGGVLGLAAGLGLIYGLKMSRFSLPKAYGFTALPLEVNYVTVLILLVGAPLLCALVALFPAFKVTRFPVVDVLRMS